MQFKSFLIIIVFSELSLGGFLVFIAVPPQFVAAQDASEEATTVATTKATTMATTKATTMATTGSTTKATTSATSRATRVTTKASTPPTQPYSTASSKITTELVPTEPPEFECYSCNNGFQEDMNCIEGGTSMDTISESECVTPWDFVNQYVTVAQTQLKRRYLGKPVPRIAEFQIPNDSYYCVTAAEWSTDGQVPTQVLRGCVMGAAYDNITSVFEDAFNLNWKKSNDSSKGPCGTANFTTPEPDSDSETESTNMYKAKVCLCNQAKCNNSTAGPLNAGTTCFCHCQQSLLLLLSLFLVTYYNKIKVSFYPYFNK